MVAVTKVFGVFEPVLDARDVITPFFDFRLMSREPRSWVWACCKTENLSGCPRGDTTYIFPTEIFFAVVQHSL